MAGRLRGKHQAGPERWSDGSNIVDGFHQLGLYTGLFLKRAKPADLHADGVRLACLCRDKPLAVWDAMIE